MMRILLFYRILKVSLQGQIECWDCYVKSVHAISDEES